MSGFIGAALPQNTIAACDQKLLSAAWRDLDMTHFKSTWVSFDDFGSGWWPGGAGLYGDQSADFGCLQTVDWEEYEVCSGQSQRYGITSVTRDVYGSPLPFCTVKLYRTSDDLLVYVSTSDGNGAFSVFTPYYPDAHFLVTYKVGTPDVFGTSVNTLVGA